MSDWKQHTIVGAQAIDAASATQQHPLGTRIEATHPDQGLGEFIYVKGVSSNSVGAFLTYDTGLYTTGLASIALGLPRPVGISMSDAGSGEYGWLQIGGLAIGSKANTTSFAAGAGLGATSGEAVAIASGLILNGAVVAVVASAKSDVTTVQVMINRPHGPADVS